MPGDFELFDALVSCAGLVVIMWVGLQSFRRERPMALPAAAVIGMIVWVGALGFAAYLVFG